MKRNSTTFLAAPFFFIRVPTFPLSYFFSLQNKNDIYQYVFNFFQTDSFFREAIAIAAPNLFDTLCSKHPSPGFQSLLKYFIRMSTRATPFGLFSFVSIGHWGAETKLDFDSSKLEKKGRPDMEWLIHFIDELLRDDSYFDNGVVKTNPLLYESLNRIILPYSIKKENKNKKISIEATPLVREILFNSINGKKVNEVICDLLVKVPDLKKGKLLEVIKILLGKEMLVPCLYPNLLTENPFRNFLEKLETPNAGLSEIEALLAEYNGSSLGIGGKTVRKIQDKLSAFTSTPNVLQVDSYYSELGSLSSKLKGDLEEAIEFLWDLSFKRKRKSPLGSYLQSFLAKYGTTRLVPLLDLLDEDMGVGIPDCFGSSNNDERLDDQWNKKLHELWSSCLFERKFECVIDKSIFSNFHEKTKEECILPSSFDVFCEILAENSVSIEEGDNYLINIKGFYGASNGCSSIGRFYYLFNEEKKDPIRKFIEREGELEPNAVFVECSYFPQTQRVGNVSINPNLRTMALNLGNSKKSDFDLSLSDILVGATEDRFYFTDRTNKKELIFVAFNMVNEELAPLPFRFLRMASMERYHTFSSLFWNDFPKVPFLPRIRYKKSVLSLAKWNVTLDLIGAGKNNTLEEIYKKFTDWANRWNLPHLLNLMNGDRSLLFDRKGYQQTREAIYQLKTIGFISLSEYLKNNNLVNSSHGAHCSEFVFPFLRNSDLISNRSFKISQISSENLSQRLHLPNSDWLYAKFYISIDNQERFLAEYLLPFVERVLKSQYYFVRYQDPLGPHVRLRISHPKKETCSLLCSWAKKVMEGGMVRDFSLGTYEREIERYGGEEVIGQAENFFCADSLTSHYLLSGMLSKMLDLPNYVIASLSIIELLRGFGLGINDQIKFFSLFKKNKKALEGFRQWKGVILISAGSIFSNQRSEDDSIRYMHYGFDLRNPARDVYLEAIKGSQASNLLTNPQMAILNSLVHMHCNRLLGIDSKLEAKALYYAAHTLQNIRYFSEKPLQDAKIKR